MWHSQGEGSLGYVVTSSRKRWQWQMFSLTAARLSDWIGRGLQLWSGLNPCRYKQLFHNSRVLLSPAHAHAHTRVERMDRSQAWMSLCWNSASEVKQQSGITNSGETNCRKMSSFRFMVCDDLSHCRSTTSSNFFYHDSGCVQFSWYQSCFSLGFEDKLFLKKNVFSLFFSTSLDSGISFFISGFTYT